MRSTLRATGLLLLVASAALAADPGLYPGAKVDQELARKAKEEARATGLPDTGAQSEIATTADPFEKVLAFYAAAGQEFRMPSPRGAADTGYERELPGGGPKVKQATVILDGAASIATSKDWVSITRPFIFSTRMEGGKMIYTDVRDVTAIVRVRK